MAGQCRGMTLYCAVASVAGLVLCHPPRMLALHLSGALQKELANIQKEKERISTTTIDDELAADPKLAEVRAACRASAGLLAWRPVVVAGWCRCIGCLAVQHNAWLCFMLQLRLCHHGWPAARRAGGWLAVALPRQTVCCPASTTLLTHGRHPTFAPCCRRLTQRSRRTTSWCPELRAQLAPDCRWSAGRGGRTPPPAALDRRHAGVAACTTACTTAPLPALPFCSSVAAPPGAAWGR